MRIPNPNKADARTLVGVGILPVFYSIVFKIKMEESA